MKEKVKEIDTEPETKYVTLNIIKDSDYIRKLDLEGYVYLVSTKDKLLIVKRVGKCDYKKCKNACCKFCSLPYPHEYWEGFGEISKKRENILCKKTCKFLDKNGTCKKWDNSEKEIDYSNGGDGVLKGFPRACEQFPSLSDGVYHEVIDVCTFKYEIIQEIDILRDKTIREMILNFKEYL
jgi:hypothetical protein